MTEKTHHVSGKKKDIAKNIQKLILDYPIIAAVDMENLPAPQLQQMRAQLRGKIELTMTKRRVIKHTIEGIKDKKKGIEQLEPHLKGMPALIFTKENPFSLFKNLKKSKTSAPAKAGQTAPLDIIVPKGPTSFMPGPVIGELAELGIKSGVEGGKVAIKEDSTVVKAGEKIPAKAAEILTRLGIEPMEVGLNVTAVYENGDIFTREVLDIDEDKFKADLEKAASGAFNLAINIEYPTKETINVLISKAFNDAKALGLSQNIIDEGIIQALLSKAEGSALSLKSTANIETVEKPKSQKPKVSEGLETKSQSEEPTPVEKKEENVLEEEKEIIKEEKQLEKERIEKEKELEKIEEQKKAEEEAKKAEEPQDDTDKKIAEMVAKTKKYVKGEIPDAEKLVEEAGKLAAKEEPKVEVKPKVADIKIVPKEEPKIEKPEEKVPTIQELKEKKPESAEEKEKKKKEQEEVANLAQELIKKGTLRK